MSGYVVVALCVVALVAVWVYAERGRLLLPSTRRMVRLSGLRRFFTGQTLYGYLYARWPYLYVLLGGRLVAPRLWPRARQALANVYHGKVLPTPLATRLIGVQQEIAVRDMEHVIPYPRARDLILQGPPDIAVIDCPCRATSPHPCEPRQVCMVVGQPYVDFMLEHHPGASRRLTTQEAVDLLEAEHRRGHIHAAYFKDAAVDRFYAICNCCKCCCGGIAAMTRYGIPMIASSGFVVEVSEERCRGCGRCVDACPFDALSVTDGRAVVDWQRCMGCGVCEGRCAVGAIGLVRDERKGHPLDVDALLEEGG